MKPQSGPSLFARVVGVFVIALASSTWPSVHWEGVIVGCGIMFGPDFIPRRK